MVVADIPTEPWHQRYIEEPELLEELNAKPARVEINGKRHYHTPFLTGPAPSVTTIISQTASEANKKKLEMWAKNNPGMKEAAAERGTSIHSCMEHYLKREEFKVPEEYSKFWDGMPPMLNQFQEVIWAETPLWEKHKFALSDDGVGRVWGCDDDGRAWAGSPDIIGVAGNKLTLADLKTSTGPYHRRWPKHLEKGSPEWRQGLGGYMKFSKCCLQLGAYDLGIEQTLGMRVQQGAILVATEERTQLFIITRNHLNIMREKWLKVVKEYYDQIKEVDDYDPDLV
jgi:hypothetical protein